MREKNQMNLCFKENLNLLMNLLKYDQKKLGKELGVSQNSISKYKSGTGYPSIDRLAQLSNLFKVSIDDLLFTPITESNFGLVTPKLNAVETRELIITQKNYIAQLRAQLEEANDKYYALKLQIDANKE